MTLCLIPIYHVPVRFVFCDSRLPSVGSSPPVSHGLFFFFDERELSPVAKVPLEALLPSRLLGGLAPMAFIPVSPRSRVFRSGSLRRVTCFFPEAGRWMGREGGGITFLYLYRS